MTTFQRRPQVAGVIKLSGKMSGYRSTRASASFVFSENDRNTMGVVAVAALLAGMGGQAASLAANSGDMEEVAERLEFELDGAPVQGWVWRSPFKEGDVVDVAAEWIVDHYEAYGVARPSDKTIALYPHCSRSRGSHAKNSVKWWAIFNAIFFGACAGGLLYIGGTELLFQPEVLLPCAGLALVFVLIFASMSWQFMPFVRLSEKICMALGLPQPRDIDLVKSSKQQRTEHDPAEFGTFYFRY